MQFIEVSNTIHKKIRLRYGPGPSESREAGRQRRAVGAGGLAPLASKPSPSPLTHRFCRRPADRDLFLLHLHGLCGAHQAVLLAGGDPGGWGLSTLPVALDAPPPSLPSAVAAFLLDGGAGGDSGRGALGLGLGGAPLIMLSQLLQGTLVDEATAPIDEIRPMGQWAIGSSLMIRRWRVRARHGSKTARYGCQELGGSGRELWK
jgi:hypothetical protein